MTAPNTRAEGWALAGVMILIGVAALLWYLATWHG